MSSRRKLQQQQQQEQASTNENQHQQGDTTTTTTTTTTTVRIKVFAFDLMYLNGISYIHKPLYERQIALRNNFTSNDGFDFVSSKLLIDYDELLLRRYLEDAVQNGAEGLMLKMLGCRPSTVPDKATHKQDDDDSTNNPSGNIVAFSDHFDAAKISLSRELSLSPYEAGTRSHSWLKVKRDYVEGYADTIDVVPIGAWYVIFSLLCVRILSWC